MMALFQERTGLNDPFNFNNDIQPVDFNYYQDFLDKPEVRKSIHVGNLTYHNVSMDAYKHLFMDFAFSVADKVAVLLDNDIEDVLLQAVTLTSTCWANQLLVYVAKTLVTCPINLPVTIVHHISRKTKFAKISNYTLLHQKWPRISNVQPYKYVHTLLTDMSFSLSNEQQYRESVKV